MKSFKNRGFLSILMVIIIATLQLQVVGAEIVSPPENEIVLLKAVPEDGLIYEIKDGKTGVIGYEIPPALLHPKRVTQVYITIPLSVDYIAAEAFYQDPSILGVTIPSSVTDIGESAFYNCNYIENITISANITEIKDHTFSDLWGLNNPITIPNSVTKLNSFAFYNCPKLPGINFSDNITEIGKCAFSGCEKIESLSLPSKLKTIGNNAFWHCESLTTLTIPSGVEEIGDEAFGGCVSLKSVTIPSSVKSIGKNVFYGYASTEETVHIYYDGLKEKWKEIGGLDCTIGDHYIIHFSDGSTFDNKEEYSIEFKTNGGTPVPETCAPEVLYL